MFHTISTNPDRIGGKTTTELSKWGRSNQFEFGRQDWNLPK